MTETPLRHASARPPALATAPTDGRSVTETRSGTTRTREETWPDGRRVTTTYDGTPGDETAPAPRWTRTVEHVPSPDGAWHDTTTWSDGRTEVAHYAPDGDLTGFSRSVPSEGGRTWHEYDAWGRLVGTTSTGPHGHCRVDPDEDGPVDAGRWETPWGTPTVSVERGPDGRETTTETYPDGSTVRRTIAWEQAPAAETVHTRPNPDGSVTTTTERPDGARWIETRDAAGRRTMQGSWDEAGAPTQETFAYDDRGGHTRTTYHDGFNTIDVYDRDGSRTGGYVWDHELGWRPDHPGPGRSG